MSNRHTFGLVAQTEMNQTAAARPKIRQGLPTLALSFVVLVAAVVGLVVRGPQTAEALVYTYAFEPGQTRVYEMKMDMKVTPQGLPEMGQAIDGALNGTLKAKVTMKTVEVRKDGSAVLELTMSNLRGTGPLGVGAQIGSQTMRMHVSSNGEILGVDGQGLFGALDPTMMFGVSTGDAGGTFGSTSLFATFPDKALKPGDTWTQTQRIPFPFGDQELTVSTSGEHEGFEDSSFGRVARMSMTIRMPFNIAFNFADILSFAAKVGGRAVESEVPAELRSARMVMSGGMNGDMTALMPPGRGDLVKMVADMKMDLGTNIENVPAAFTQGAPQSFKMLADMRMEMVRIA